MTANPATPAYGLSGRHGCIAKLYAVGAGTNEIRRLLIGRELFEERH